MPGVHGYADRRNKHDMRYGLNYNYNSIIITILFSSAETDLTPNQATYSATNASWIRSDSAKNSEQRHRLAKGPGGIVPSVESLFHGGTLPVRREIWFRCN